MSKKQYIIKFVLSILLLVCGEIDYGFFIYRIAHSDFSIITWVDLAVSLYLTIFAIVEVVKLVKEGYKKKK